MDDLEVTLNLTLGNWQRTLDDASKRAETFINQVQGTLDTPLKVNIDEIRPKLRANFTISDTYSDEANMTEEKELIITQRYMKILLLLPGTVPMMMKHLKMGFLTIWLLETLNMMLC